MTRIGLPFQAESPVYIPCLNGKVHAAEGRLKVAISSHEGGHQSPRLCVLREAYGLNLETFGWAVSPPSVPPPRSPPLLLLTWEVVNSGAWSLMSVMVTVTSHVLLRPEAGEGVLGRPG